METISTQRHGYGRNGKKELVRRVSVAAGAFGILAAGLIAGAGNDAHAEPLREPVPVITGPHSALVLVRYGETDRAAGMPKFAYVEANGAKESPLGLDPRIVRRINEGVEPVQVAVKSPPRSGATVRVRYGETDRANGMPEYEDVPVFVGGKESPLGLDPGIAARINEGVAPVKSPPAAVLTIRVRYGETDRSAGMSEYADIPVPSGVPTAAEIAGLPPFGETDFFADIR